MHIQSLGDLYMEELKDLYSGEQQILEALPMMAAKVTDPELRNAFTEHVEQTREHVNRLNRIFQRLGCDPNGKTCIAMQALIQETQEIMQHAADGDTLDAALIACAQKVEHYEIAGYGTATNWAMELGDEEAADLLKTTAEEEGRTDKRLTALAERGINREAERAAA